MSTLNTLTRDPRFGATPEPSLLRVIQFFSILDDQKTTQQHERKSVGLRYHWAWISAAAIPWLIRNTQLAEDTSLYQKHSLNPTSQGCEHTSGPHRTATIFKLKIRCAASHCSTKLTSPTKLWNQESYGVVAFVKCLKTKRDLGLWTKSEKGMLPSKKL